MRIGAVHARGKCDFAVWAPNHKQVDLWLPDEESSFPMQRDSEGYWRTTSDAKRCFKYMYRLDGKMELPDPASHFQPDGVIGPSMIVDHEKYRWQDNNWKGLELKDMIFYELHIGTFTEEGTFNAATGRIKELVDTGINAVELMPIAQFSGKRNWGYDIAFPFAAQNSYGTPDDLKAFVDECHRSGAAVFLDVVYNHAGPEGNYLNEYGPYFLANRMTAWGPTVNLDGLNCQHVRNYFMENTLHWFIHYHIDGLRFDAVLSMPDTSPKHFLQEINEHVCAYSEKAGQKLWLVAESGFNEPKVLASFKDGGFGFDAQWLDDFHHSLFSLITGEREGYYKNYGRLEDIVEVLTEAYAYVGIRTHMHRRHNNESFTWIPSSRLIVFAQNHDQVGNRLLGERLVTLAGLEAGKLSAGLVLLSPYVPLLFMGEEYAEDAPFTFFVDYASKELAQATRLGRAREFANFHWKEMPCDPASPETFQTAKLNWNKRHKGKNAQILTYYKTLIRLRRELDNECFGDRYKMQLATSGERVLFMRRCNRQDGTVMVANFNSQPETAKWPFEGNYTKILDSAEPTWAGSGATLPQNIRKEEAHTLAGFNFAIYKRLSTGV